MYTFRNESAARARGFTLIELILVMALLALLSAIAIPEMVDWRRRAHYNEAAQGVATTLREARAQALSRNLQHRVEFEMGNRRYRIIQGNRPINSTAFATVVKNWTSMPADITLRGAADCSVTTTLSLDFNANGTATQNDICIMSALPTVTGQYRVGIPSATTGRVVVSRF